MLVAIARAVQHTNGLYLAYNKSVATSSSRKFPKTTQCVTTHSLAYQATVRSPHFKLSLGTFSQKHISSRIHYDDRVRIVDHIRIFCLSRFTSFDDYATDIKLSSALVSQCKHHLDRMQSGAIECTHEFYLKLFHILLSNGTITYKPFDFIMLDEAGDLNEVTLEIFKLLPTERRIAVGDPCMPGTQRILTSKGWRRLSTVVKSLEKNEPVYVKSFNTSTEKFEFKPALNPVRSGKKQCYKIKTTRSSIECTANHRILTPNGYIRADELSKGSILVKDGSPELSNVKRLLNDDQYQVLLGSYLGDGHLQKLSPYEYRLSVSHSEKQKNYLQWKASIFSSDIKSASDAKPHSIKGTACNTANVYNFCTKTFVLQSPIEFTHVRHMTPLALAVWLMDDGSLRNKYSSKNYRLSITIDSNAYSLRQNQFLVSVLKRNFNLTATVQKTRNYYRLSFSKEQSLKLLSIVQPYLHDDFLNKFKHTPSDPPHLDSTYSPYAVDVVTSIQPTAVKETFDIEVADNHNFIASSTAQKTSASGVVVHNCQNIYQFNHTINCFKVLKDQGTTFRMTKTFRTDSHIAKRIETFCQSYLDTEMSFTGVNLADKSIHTRAFITRTNAVLIDRMIDFNRQGIPYGLMRPAYQIFRIPLMLCAIKYQGFITEPEYRSLQVDIDDWYEDDTLQTRFKSPLLYLADLYSDDMQLTQAIRLVMKHKKPAIIEASRIAKSHESSNQQYILTTCHSCKGAEFDEVTIADDLNDSIDDIVGSINAGRSLSSLDESDIESLNLYYVAVTRAAKQLNNARHLI